MFSFQDIPLRTWRFQTWEFSLGRFPLLMGIVNVTPDSFSDGGHFLTLSHAVDHALRLVAEGADILDIGGESTRPYSEPVSETEELARVIPVIEQLRSHTQLPISIDTTKARVAREALAAGANIVNDISGLTFDEAMIPLCVELNTGVIAMHIQGTPQTMQDDPFYADAVTDIRNWLQQRVQVMTAAGIPAERIVLDPGIGFGKTARHNLEILGSIGRFRELGHPVLIGHSRKGFLKKILGRDVNERTFGTLGVSLAAAMQGADILRVHDIQATRDALLAWKVIVEQMTAGSDADERVSG